jgi:hypothetical protein
MKDREIENIIKSWSKGVGKLTTHYGSHRKLETFVDNTTGRGMLFIGINKETNKANSIRKYIYFQELTNIKNKLIKNQKISFKEIGEITAGNCATHIAIVILSEILNIGFADYHFRKLTYKKRVL